MGNRIDHDKRSLQALASPRYLALADPIVQWPRTPPFHGGNTGSNPVRVACYRKCFILSHLYRSQLGRFDYFANGFAKISTEIHCFETNLRILVVGRPGSHRNSVTVT